VIPHLDAIETAADITGTYRRYLQTLLAVRDPQLDAALRRAISQTRLLDKGPYLEATPPYRPGASCADLIAEGVLHPGFTGLESPALPLERPLYVHQEQAIRKIAAGRNVVVATGTGSGKTESFLLPILDSLVTEEAGGELGPGIRALLLYPMNALANDQMKRMRALLAAYPGITFGRYTGETPNDAKTARERFGELNIGEPLIPNELLSREEMRASPPHILLTNYAMLEYLLLRPQDMDLFQSGEQSRWRFIVVDEAHVYDGTQGAEIAMLLRRVRDRVTPDRTVQCIATSATVGGDSEPSAVTTFAERLFGEPFEWVDGDVSRQDLIRAKRVAPDDSRTWGPLTPSDYVALAEMESPADWLLEAAARSGFYAPDAATALGCEQSLVTLRSLLRNGPLAIGDAVRGVFGEERGGRAALASLVNLASSIYAVDGSPVLSARYHLFLRATEGAFTCLSEAGPHVHLARHEACPDCQAPVFEIGSCKRCGAVHLVGRIETEQGKHVLRPRRSLGAATWLVLGQDGGLIDEDEAAVETSDDHVDGDSAMLCSACGTLSAAEARSCTKVTCGSARLRTVRRLNQRGMDEVQGCLVCGARGEGAVRRFETGPDASGAVIATSLYQRLPASARLEDRDRPGEGRKLLMFSDSRQSAAYFAPYLEDSYARIQRRRLIMQGLASSAGHGDPVGVEDLVFAARKHADSVRNFKPRMTAQQQMREVAPWVMAEALALDDRISLEGLGLVRITLERSSSWAAPSPLLSLGLTEDEAWDFIQELLRTLRQQGAVTMPENVPPNHEIFAPRLGPIYARLEGPARIHRVLSWLPGRGTNRRIAYTTKVLAELGASADPRTILEGVWRFLTSGGRVDWLKSETQQGLGTVTRIDHELLRFTRIDEDAPIYRCSLCGRVAPFSIRGICPSLGCEGRLEVYSPPAYDTNHYRTTYRTMRPVPLRSQEHTAQWKSTEAAQVQQDFIHGEINALSCSTTFELGVDVGDLQAVLLRNMPPSTANYVQRAGRAGRRSGSAALVVTYAQRRSHDLAKFADPRSMMSGEVRAPFVPLVNERIDRRHAHSVALAAFFRWLFETTSTIHRTAGEFFLPDDSGREAAVTQVRGFLTPVPPQVRASLERVLPEQVKAEIGLAEDEWVDALVDLLESVRLELASDVGELEKLLDEAAGLKNFRRAEGYTRVINTLKRRDLLGFLANRNVLPKYGFPVDSVELRTSYSLAAHQVGARLELSRDLSQAIYEYAPDASIVAGGQQWTSRGLYRLPGRDLVEFRYLVCKECGGFRQALEEVDPRCPVCGIESDSAPRTLTVPEFGFVAARESQRPGARPPRRSWSGATHVLRESESAREHIIELGGGQLHTQFGPRARLVAIADGPGGMGFWVCKWCGYGAARMLHPKRLPAHDHLLRGSQCKGPADLLDLAHTYETDLLRIDVLPAHLVGTQSAHLSVLYAVLEAACNTLEISRDDIGGTLMPHSTGSWSFTFFDAVPGGAGHVLMVEKELPRILRAAYQRVSDCDCGDETSCYGCLRSYSNQRHHEELSRGVARAVLGQILGADIRERDPAAAPKLETAEERLIRSIVDLGAPPPVIGHESEQGLPIPLSWPDAKTAVAFDLDASEREELEQEGWSLLPPDPTEVAKAFRTQ